jgi:hypothetical protein
MCLDGFSRDVTKCHNREVNVEEEIQSKHFECLFCWSFTLVDSDLFLSFAEQLGYNILACKLKFVLMKEESGLLYIQIELKFA